MIASNKSAATRARWYRAPPAETKPKHKDIAADRSMIVGVELRNALTALHLSSREFARLSGVTSRTVKRWLVETEPGRIPLWVDHLLHDLGMKLSVGRRSGPITQEQIRRYEMVEMGLEKLAAHLLAGDMEASRRATVALNSRLKAFQRWIYVHYGLEEPEEADSEMAA